MTVCSMLGCKNRMHKGCGKHFFRFPLKDPERLAKWMEAVQRNFWTPTIHSKVCSDHFTEKDYMIRPGAACPYLRMDAVPTSLYPARRKRKAKKKKGAKASASQGSASNEVQEKAEDQAVEESSKSNVNDSREEVMDGQASQEAETQAPVAEDQDGKRQEENEGGEGRQGAVAQGDMVQGEVTPSEEQREVLQEVEAQNEEQGEVAQGVDKGVVVQSMEQGMAALSLDQRIAAQGLEQGAATESMEQRKAAESEVGEEQGQLAQSEGQLVQSRQHMAEMVADGDGTRCRRNMTGLQIEVQNDTCERQMLSLANDRGLEFITFDHPYSTVTGDKENDVPAPPGNPKVVKLRKKIKTLQKQVLRQGAKIKSLKQTLSDLRRNNLVERDPERVISEHCSGLALALFTNQLKNGHKRYNAIQYCGLMKEFALNLYYASPKAYKFLRLFLCLPHPVSLRHWKIASEGNLEPLQGEHLQNGPLEGETMHGEPLQVGPLDGQTIQEEPLQDGPLQGEPLQDGPLQGEPLQDGPLQVQPLEDGLIQVITVQEEYLQE